MKSHLSEADSEAVIKILLNELDVTRSQLTPDAKFIEDLGADSLTMVEINMALEDQLDVTIPDELAERIHTMGDLFESLADLLQSRHR